jgi:small subunit ribosomal protein S6
MVLDPEATEEEVSATTERVDGLINRGGGSVTEHQSWGLRRLAFPVMNRQEGNYVLTRFALDPLAVIELGRGLKASEGILRFLVTKVEKRARPPAPDPSPPQKKEGG